MKRLLIEYGIYLICDFWLVLCLLNCYNEGFYQNSMKVCFKGNAHFCFISCMFTILSTFNVIIPYVSIFIQVQAASEDSLRSWSLGQSILSRSLVCPRMFEDMAYVLVCSLKDCVIDYSFFSNWFNGCEPMILYVSNMAYGEA